MEHEPSTTRLLLILAAVVGSHLVALAARRLSRRFLRSRIASETKLVTITGFATSSLIFAVYFAAIGFILQELGISLTTYLASASVIGLAVSFGSQGFIRAYLDVRLPEDRGSWPEAEARVGDVAQAAYQQYRGILLLPPEPPDAEPGKRLPRPSALVDA